MEKKMSANVERSLINCHLSVLTFVWNKLFLTEFYFLNEENSNWIYYTHLHMLEFLQNLSLSLILVPLISFFVDHIVHT